MDYLKKVCLNTIYGNVLNVNLGFCCFAFVDSTHQSDTCTRQDYLISQNASDIETTCSEHFVADSLCCTCVIFFYFQFL